MYFRSGFTRRHIELPSYFLIFDTCANGGTKSRQPDFENITSPGYRGQRGTMSKSEILDSLQFREYAATFCHKFGFYG